MDTIKNLPGLRSILSLSVDQFGRRLDDPDAIRAGIPECHPRNDGGSVPMIAENWPTLLVPGLRKIWHTSFDETEKTFKRTEIFPIESSVKAKETFQGVGELGSEMWNEYNKLGRVPYGGLSPVWPQELVHRRYAAGLQVEREVMDDNLYAEAPIPREITAEVKALGRSAAIHRERSAAALFNNAFTDSGTDAEGHPIAGPDGVGLVSTAHKHSATNTVTQSNEFTLALTGANLTTVSLAMRAFTDDQGALAPSHPDTLLVPPALEEQAQIINQSALDPTSANNAINPQRGKWNIEVWDWLTDTNAWFLIDSARKQQSLVWLDRVKPEFSAEQSFDTGIGKWKGYYRFSRGWADWRWIAGSNPS